MGIILKAKVSGIHPNLSYYYLYHLVDITYLIHNSYIQNKASTETCISNILQFIIKCFSIGALIILTVWSWMFPFSRTILRPSDVVCSILPDLQPKNIGNVINVNMVTIIVFVFVAQKEQHMLKRKHFLVYKFVFLIFPVWYFSFVRLALVLICSRLYKRPEKNVSRIPILWSLKFNLKEQKQKEATNRKERYKEDPYPPCPSDLACPLGL